MQIAIPTLGPGATVADMRDDLLLLGRRVEA